MKNKVFILFVTLLVVNVSFSQTKFVKKEISLKAPYVVEVYTMPFCGHCKVVESKLKTYNISYVEKNIFLSKKLQAEMRKRSHGEEGTPRIFINDHYIGGRKDFDQLNDATLMKLAKGQPITINIKVPDDEP